MSKTTRRSVLLGSVLVVGCAWFFTFGWDTGLPGNETPYIRPGLAQSALSGELRHRVFLVGDAGKSTLDPLQPSLKKIAGLAAEAPEKSSILLLGDNIYTMGFPSKAEDQDEYNEEQLEDISHLEAQLYTARLSGAELFVVPGNHDWLPAQVDTQADYVERYAATHDIRVDFAPHRPGQPPLPEVTHREGVSLVFLDSTWLIFGADDPDFEKALATLGTLLLETASEYPENIVLVVAHHPVETMGLHGLYYTDYRTKVIMSTLKWIGDIGDVDHPRYQRYIDRLEEALRQHPRAIYAAGHDHNLQVFEDGSGASPQYRLVSGAGNALKVNTVGTNDNTLFALAQEGFMSLDFLDSGLLLRVYDVQTGDPVFEKDLYAN